MLTRIPSLCNLKKWFQSITMTEQQMSTKYSHWNRWYHIQNCDQWWYHWMLLGWSRSRDSKIREEKDLEIKGHHSRGQQNLWKQEKRQKFHRSKRAFHQARYDIYRTVLIHLGMPKKRGAGKYSNYNWMVSVGLRWWWTYPSAPMMIFKWMFSEYRQEVNRNILVE